MAWVPKPFKLQFDEKLANSGINVTIDDVLFNRIDKVSQTLREDGISWCGPKEKHFKLLSIIIQTCSYESNFVLVVGTCANHMIIIFLEGNNNLLVWIYMYMWWCLNSCMCTLSKNFLSKLVTMKTCTFLH